MADFGGGGEVLKVTFQCLLYKLTRMNDHHGTEQS